MCSQEIGDYLFQCLRCRHNPLARLRWQKNKMTHPVGYQKARTRATFNFINPLCYIRRIKYNLSGVGGGYIGVELILRDGGNLASINEGPG